MQGSCLCGAVAFETNKLVAGISACHCGMCNKWNGGPFIAIELKEKFTTKGEDNISFYRSSTWGTRAFCKVCGTHLFYKANNTTAYYLNAALFEDLYKRELVSVEIFTDRKPNYYGFLSEESQKLTEKDIIEAMPNT